MAMTRETGGQTKPEFSVVGAGGIKGLRSPKILSGEDEGDSRPGSDRRFTFVGGFSGSVNQQTTVAEMKDWIASFSLRC